MLTAQAASVFPIKKPHGVALKSLSASNALNAQRLVDEEGLLKSAGCFRSKQVLKLREVEESDVHCLQVSPTAFQG